ncbi:hypothetical protein BgAZ_403150 [Babesia gibsoni]|uniref:Exportin-1/Importin-beta-like domain-containing protein n=1 Tax=Babesia gibsoni TaxID=33632 RepID=A0AAD8LRJ8_BABGI|nr:hypothetical protein BgAZ_403150 [Babesia gibsoni]
MVSAELVEAVFAAHDGNFDASNQLQELVKAQKDPSGPAATMELQQQLLFRYDLLNSLTKLSYIRSDDEVIAFLSKSGAAAIHQNYIECVDILRFYGFTLLVKFVENNWHRLTEDVKMRCKKDVEDIFACGSGKLTLASEYNILAIPKVSQYLATIAIREWPVGWTEFIPLCLQSINNHFVELGMEASGCKQTMAELCIFGSMLSEISDDITDCMDNKILYKKRSQILQLFQKHICDIFIMLHRVIVLGMHKGQPSMLQLVITIFRNLSGIMDGNIFIEFDIDDFLRANVGSAKSSDVIQTFHNICASVDQKQMKNVQTPSDFKFSTPEVYKAKLDRFVRNLVALGESMALDCSLESTCEELQLSQAIKVLFEKNGVTVLTSVSGEALSLLCDYILARLVMHPSLQIATSAITSLNVMIRRMTSLGDKYLAGDYLGGVFVPNPSAKWLDIQRILLVLFIRCLKIGNVAIQQDVGEHSSSETVDAFVAEAIGAPILKSQRWSKLLFAYVPIDDEFCVGQLKNFDTRFAALRSAILNCVALLAAMSHDYMNLTIKALADIFINAQRMVMDEPCLLNASICTTPGISEKRLQWTCKKLVFFDGTCFMFEAALFRIRGVTIDASHNTDTTKIPEWMNPQTANKALMAAQSRAAGNMVDTWISSALTYLMHMLSLPLPSVHGAQLEVRRLSLLSSSAVLLVYNQEPMERILEYVVGLLLVQASGNWEVTKVHKSALMTLVTICKCCSSLISHYVEPIIQRVQQCASTTENESSRDLLLESMVALTSCTQNFEAQRRLSQDIIAPYTEEIKKVASTLLAAKPEERPKVLFELLYSSSHDGDMVHLPILPQASSLPLSNGDGDDILESTRRTLRRALTMTLSILKCSVVPQGLEHRTKGGFLEGERIKHPLEDKLTGLLSSVCTILSALSGMWRPAFRAENEWRQAVLSPGEEEWISLQGFNEAIATEDSLRRIIESVFKIPSTMDPKVVHKCRRHDFLLRQSALKLCGEIFTIAITHKINLLEQLNEELVKEALIEPLSWAAMSHLAQFLKLALIPAKLIMRNSLCKIISTVMERINCEWKALNRVQRNLLEEQCGVSTSGADSRILHLYYLRVYACNETGIQLLALVGNIFKTKLMVTVESESEYGAEEVIMDGSQGSEQISVVFGSRELMTCILQCLSSAVCWPHCRCVTDSLRLLRAYAKLSVELDPNSVKLAESFAMEILLMLHNQLRMERTFDPLNLGNDEGQGSTTTAYKRFWSNTKDGSNNYIKEFVNTMCTFYECLIRCQPGLSSVLSEGEINVQALMAFGSMVEAIKMLTPYLQEQECLNFLKSMLTQNSVLCRTILQAGIEENIKDQKESTNAKLVQFNASVLEPRSAIEIEKRNSDDSDSDFLGSDIAYLLFE